MGWAAVAMALPGCIGASQRAAGRGKRPNILFLFTDDQRFDTINALGNKDIITPNIDRLVRNGTTFTKAYIMGGTSPAVCAPSRAMLMTGRTLFHVEKKGTWDYNISKKYKTLPEALRTAGYTTFGTGKWHNGGASYARSFSTGAKIMFGGMSDHYDIPVHDFNPAGKYPREKRYQLKGKHSSELYADAAIQFLQHYEDKNPFFMYVSFQAPHDPRDMPKEYLDMYDPEKIPLPRNFMPEHPFDNGEMKVRDEGLTPWPRTPGEIRKHIAAYYAMITHMDAQIGRVLESLRKTGQAENTIIVFAGDNGLAVGRHGLMGKQNVYEHSVHVPLIFSGPGIPQGRKRDAFCYLFDIYPTLCEMTGTAVPDTVEGKSLSPLLKNKKARLRDTMFFAYRDFQRSVRDHRYKLIEYMVKGKRTTQLFDLQSDPWEIKNLIDDPGYAKHRNRLRKELLRWREQLDDVSDFGEFGEN